MKDLIRFRLDDDDRRDYARAVKFTPGCVLYEGRTLECLVIDLSINGARLLFDQPLPDWDRPNVQIAFNLRLATPRDLPARIAWRDGQLIGVQFLEPPTEVAVVLEGVLPKACLEAPTPNAGQTPAPTPAPAPATTRSPSAAPISQPAAAPAATPGTPPAPAAPGPAKRVV